MLGKIEEEKLSAIIDAESDSFEHLFLTVARLDKKTISNTLICKV